MLLPETLPVLCPYCGEPITAEVDPASGSHDFIEDCPVCCSPIEYRAVITVTGEISLEAKRDDDA